MSIDARAWALLASFVAVTSLPSGAVAAKMKGDAAATCGGLVGAMENAVRIDSAAMQAPSPISVAERGPAPAARVVPAQPEFCKVIGRIEPTDPKAAADPLPGEPAGGVERRSLQPSKRTWMPGTSPGMTTSSCEYSYFTSEHPPSASGRNACSAGIVETSL